MSTCQYKITFSFSKNVSQNVIEKLKERAIGREKEKKYKERQIGERESARDSKLE